MNICRGTVNYLSDILKIEQRVFFNKVLDQFGWHLTLTGAVIYSRSVISSIDEIDSVISNFFAKSNLKLFISKQNILENFFA